MLSARRTQAALLFLLLAASLAAALLLKHHGVGTPIDAMCGAETVSGCDVVNQSAYSKLLGVPLAAIGLVFYVTLAGSLALALFAGDAVRAGVARLALGALALSLAVDLVLLGLQAGQLHAYCVLCLLTYAMGASALVALWPARRAEVGQTLAAGEGRLVLVGSAIAALASIVAVATHQIALQARPSTPMAMFGTGAPRSPVGSAGTGQAADALRRSQQEVQRLQTTLDDPQKLEQYFSEKALREFEQAKAQSFDLTGVPSKGPADAPIKLVEFSDFLCPYCKQLAEGLGAFLPQTGGRVKLYYKQYPMDSACNDSLKQQIHQGACLVALGGVCAAEQDRFWQYHDRLFSKQGQETARPQLVRVAGEVGLDAAAFGACLDRPETAEKLRAQIREGTAAGVKGTPTIFINGRRVTRMNDFVAMLDKEAARLGLPPLPSPQPPRR